MTIKINEEHLGDIATKRDAVEMIRCLQSEGVDAIYGQPMREDEKPSSIPDETWSKCLDTTNSILALDNKYKR